MSSYPITQYQKIFSKRWGSLPTLLILAALIFPIPSQAANWWDSTGGPSGGSVYTVVIDPITPTIHYAGTDQGAFKSIDGGSRWVAINTGLSNTMVVLSLIIDPATPTTLYAGIFGRGVFKSTDSGASWTAINTGLTVISTTALAVDPVTPNILYAGTIDGVFKSTDSGANWVATTGMPLFARVSSLIIDPSTPSTVYAGTWSGVFKSVDGGATWTAMNAGLINKQVRALVIDPLVPSTLYVGIGSGSFGGFRKGIFKSTDSGATWVESITGLTSTNIESIAIDPTTPSTLYVGTWGGEGIFKSIDNGNTWTTASRILAGGFQVTSGPIPTGIFSLTINANNTPATLYAGTSSGAFKSIESIKEEAWTGPLALGKADILAITVDPTSPRHVVYAGSGGGGIFQGTSIRSSGLSDPLILSIAVDAASSVEPYTRVSSTVYAGSNNGIFKSTNGSFSWVASGLVNNRIQTIAIDPTTPSTIYAGSSSLFPNSGIFKSMDNGNSWTAINTGLTNRTIKSIVIDSTTSTTLYAGTSGGVFKSIDSGNNWIAINTGLTSTNITTVAINPSASTTLYVGTFGSGMFKSVDSGSNWTAINTGLTGTNITAIVIDPVTPSTLYAGTYSGVFKSLDNGTNWATMNIGLANLTISSLAIDPSTPTTLYAGVAKSGVQIMSAGNITINASTDVTTNNREVRLSIYCGQCAQMEFSNDSINWSTPIAGSSSIPSYTLAAGPDGPRTVYARFTHSSGNVSTVINDSITLDTTLPTTPTITSPSNNIITNSTAAITIAGTASIDANTIRINDNGIFRYGTTGSSNWSLTTFGLAEGVHVFTAYVFDAAGNISPTSTAITYTVDTTAPIISPPTNITVKATTVAGTRKVASAISTFLNSATTTDAIDISGLAANDAPATFPVGKTLVTFSATDTAGNTAVPVTASVTVLAFTPTAENNSTSSTSSTSNTTSDSSGGGCVTLPSQKFPPALAFWTLMLALVCGHAARKKLGVL